MEAVKKQRFKVLIVQYETFKKTSFWTFYGNQTYANWFLSIKAFRTENNDSSQHNYFVPLN